MAVGTLSFEVTPNAHSVVFYDTEDDLVARVASFVADGFSAAEAVVVVVTPAHLAAIDAALRAEGIDPEQARAAGRYLTLDAADTLALLSVDGAVEPGAFRSAASDLLMEAGRSGLPVRVFGEVVAMLWANGDVEQAIQLEGLWNELAHTHSFSLLCAYPIADIFASDDLAGTARVCSHHSEVQPPDHYESPADLSTALSDRVSAIFIPVPSAVRAARHFVVRALTDWGDQDLSDDAALITSELAANAVLHATSPFRVTVDRARGTVCIAVEDTHTATPKRRHPSAELPGGRGMTLVDGLSARWGTTVGARGKVIWSELDRPVG